MKLPRLLLLAATLLSTFVTASAQDGAPAVRFTPGVQTDIYAFVVQSGAVVAGGTRGSGTDSGGNFFETPSLNRYLSSTGLPDPNFDVRPDGAVYALAGYPDGRLLVAGDFSQLNIGGDVTSATGIARLNADGSLDETFTASVTRVGADPKILSVVLQPEGRILIGGAFDAVNGSARGGVARLLADGKVDPSFVPGGGPGADQQVVRLALQGDRVLVAGDFKTFNGEARAGLVRLVSTGALDPIFDPKLDVGSIALTLLVDAASNIYVSGQSLSRAGVAQVSLLRLDPDGGLGAESASFNAAAQSTPINGSPDPRFAQNPPATPPAPVVAALLQLPDGRLLVGGLFDGTVAGVPYHNLVRLFPDGTLDYTFSLPANPDPSTQPELLAVDALALQADGTLLVGTNVPPNYGRPIPGFPTDPIVNIIINAVSFVGFRASDYTASAGAPSVDIAVKRFYGTAAGSLVVNLADGTAKSPRDYQATSATLTWPAGDTSDRQMTITIPNTSQGGTVKLSLANPTSGIIVFASGAKSTLTIPLAPMPTPTPTPPPGSTPTPTPTPPPGGGNLPVVTVSVSDKGKTIESGPKLQIVFHRAGDVSQALTVLYKASGTAMAGENYKALSGSVVIPAGAADATVKFKPIDDGEANGTRQVTVKVKADPTGRYIVGDPKKALIKIKDND